MILIMLAAPFGVFATLAALVVDAPSPNLFTNTWSLFSMFTMVFANDKF